VSVTAKALCLTALLCAAFDATPARAQSAGSGPGAGGLFAGKGTDTRPRDQLNLFVDVSDGYNSELPPEFNGGTDALHTGYNSMLTATADYAHPGRSVQIIGSGVAAVGYSKTIDHVVPISNGGSLEATVQLPGAGDVQASQTFAYSPSYLHELFPTGAVSEINPDYQIAQVNSYSYDSRMTVGFGSVRGTRVTTTAEYTHTRFEAASTDFALLTLAAKVQQAISPRAHVSFEYDHRIGGYALGTTREDRLTIGADYAYPLSRRRRATFHGSLSPSTLEVPAPLQTDFTETTADRGGRVFAWQGEAGVECEFRANWRASVTYRRDMNYLPVLATPLLSNGTYAEFSALLTRRFDMTAHGGYASGQSGFDSRLRNLITSTAEARARYGLSRSIAAYVEYLYYRYDFRDQTPAVVALPTGFRQHGIRVGMMLFARPLGK
jgi:hypothetical protein